MYAGHAAIALALKAREPRLPIVALALACYGPDWVELALMLPRKNGTAGLYSHSIPAVVVGAALAAGVYAAFRRPGVRLIFLGWLLHWPGDMFTGRKPLFDAAPLIGLDLYALPLVDFVLESTVVVIGCVIYARRFAPRGAARRTVVILGAALILLQGAVDVALAVVRDSEWRPSLALGEWQPQLSCHLQGAGNPGSACVLHFSTRTSTAREQWLRTAPGA